MTAVAAASAAAPERRLPPLPQPANSAFAVALEGRVDSAALARSLEELVRRHPALCPDGDAAVVAPLQTIGLGRLPEAERRDAARRLANEHARRPFADDEPRLRATLLECSEQDSVLVVAALRAAVGEEELVARAAELAQLYEGIEPARGAAAETPGADASAAAYAHWRATLAGATPLLDFPVDRQRPAKHSFAALRADAALGDDVTKALGRVARELGATLDDVLLAVSVVFLARHTRQRDLVIGIAGPGDGTILPLRVRLRDAMRFEALVGAARDAVAAARAHGRIELSRLVDLLDVERPESHFPLVQAAVSFAPPPGRALAFASLRAEEVPLDEETPFDLDLAWWREEGVVHGRLRCAASLFDQATAERFAARLAALAEAAAADPSSLAAELPLLAAEEREAAGRASTGPVLPLRHATLLDLWRARVAASRGETAVVDGTGELSYGELDARANRLANLLRAHGVGRESVVAVSVGRTNELAVCFLAILKCGAAYLPLDPLQPWTRLDQIVASARPRVIVTVDAVAAQLPLDGRDALLLDDLEVELARQSEGAPATVVSPDSLAYVIYTSGSTGAPKGVELTHAGAASLAAALEAIFAVTARDRVAFFSALGFDASIWEILMAFGAAAALCFVDTHERTTAEIARDLRDLGVTVGTFPPSFLRAIEGEPLPAVRLMIGAGEQCPAELVRAWAVGRTFVNAYGPTEATVCATYAECTPTGPPTPPIGRPIPNVAVHVLDDRLQLVPPGVVGELYLAGAGLARCYREDARATAAAFLPDPHAELGGGRLYKTGDLVRQLPSGELVHVGRVDEQVKLRGFRIELGEVRQALLRHHQVADAVVAIRDGGGAAQLVAHVVLTTEARLLAARSGLRDGDWARRELHDALEATLPTYMLPSTYVVIDALPLLPNGKIDHAALADSAAVEDPGADVLEPETPMEQLVARIWSDRLELQRVSRNDSFLELGGHSLVAAQVIADLRAQLRVRVPVRMLFEHAVLSELAEALTAAVDEATAAEA